MLLSSRRIIFSIIISLILLGYGFCHFVYADLDVDKSKIGMVVDEFNGVKVYYNGSISNVSGRNVAKDGYSLGLKYQCVEFIKRYYYERFNHKMPDSYGHAKDFFLMIQYQMEVSILNEIYFSFIMDPPPNLKLMILLFLIGLNMVMLPSSVKLLTMKLRSSSKILVQQPEVARPFH